MGSQVNTTVLGDGVGLITINRPKVKNAFGKQTYRDFIAALRSMEGDETVRVVVITGEGSYFSSGADLRDDEVLEGKSIDAPVGRFMMEVIHFPKILMAAVNGPAIGIGATLIPHCDMAYAAPSAYFWTPFARISVVPEFCSSILFPATMGMSKANEMLIAGGKMPADEAARCGFISEVLTGTNFVEQVLAKAKQVASVPAADHTLPLFKSMIRTPRRREMEETCRRELAELDKRVENGDIMAAVMALMQQRAKM